MTALRTTGWIAGLLVAGLAGGSGCGAPAEAPPPVAHASTDTSRAPLLDADDPTLLVRPFSAEEIRREWTAGLTLDLRRRTPEGEELERWIVVSADAEGADIGYVALDADGAPIGEQRVERAGWIELRDHASFPAEHATREEAKRETALGPLDGWIYTVRDEPSGTVSEFFFAASLPGAPVEMRMTRGDELLLELAQIARSRADP